MIWVIGDIHGMFDPLKRLMTKLMELHYNRAEGCEIERLIFIGDYIDYGPSSKEVIDFLIDLPFDKVFLMGNHDDLLLQFVKCLHRRNPDGAERLEAACRRALAIRGLSYKSVKSILDCGLEQKPVVESVEVRPVQHENLRGAGYYGGSNGEEEAQC